MKRPTGIRGWSPPWSAMAAHLPAAYIEAVSPAEALADLAVVRNLNTTPPAPVVLRHSHPIADQDCEG